MMSDKTYYLSTTQVLAVHDQMIKRFGGSYGIRDIGLIESALLRPQSTFDGKDLYFSIYDKAAALLHSLLKNHPFVDGNKRTALTATGIFLILNGFKLVNSQKEEVSFTLKVANNTLTLQKIALWLEKHTNRI